MRRVWLIGIAGAAALTGAAAMWPAFLDLPSLLLTVGGSVGVVCFSYPQSQLRASVAAVWGLLTEPARDVELHARELSRLTEVYRSAGMKGLERLEPLLHDPFLRRGVAMLVDLQRSERIYSTLSRELATVLARLETARQILLTLGKVLPAFGLIGTLLGMVILLKDIAAPDAPSLPAALSLAVLTTLYGALLANVVVAPLAARVHAAAVQSETRMQLTLEWLSSLLRRETASLIPLKPRNRNIPARVLAASSRKSAAQSVAV